MGRSGELGVLRTLLPRIEGESRRVVLLGGEPGTGKSRLAREFAAAVTQEDAIVLYGECDAVVHTPYGPFVPALEQLVRIVDPTELRAMGGARELTRLLPELGAHADRLPSLATIDPDTERHRLHAAVTDLLAGASRSRPVLLVLEDIHWADPPTLVLLRHLARRAWVGRVLVFASFRDTDADMPELLAQTLADLRRSDDIVRLRLGQLSGDEVSEFVTRAVQGLVGSAQAEVARTITDLTGGNAFLVCELWRSLLETRAVEVVGGVVQLTRPAAELGTPESVREVVSERLARLGPQTTALLELAATVGTEFKLEIVRRSSGLGEDEFVAALDEAIRSGIIEQLPSGRLANRFTHELVRRAVYDRLTGARRALLHLRVGEAQEASTQRSTRALTDLAHHFSSAAPLGDARRAVHYSILAARAAIASLAFEQAAALLGTALELGIESPAEQAEALLELGTAHHRAGKAREALQAFRSAAEIVRTLHDPNLLARAAIGLEEGSWRPGMLDAGTVSLLEEAIATIGDEAPELHVALLSGLARTLDYKGQHERAAVVRSSAIALARTHGDLPGLANVLVRSYWSRGMTPDQEVLAMLTEAKAISEKLGHSEVHAEAMTWRVPTFVALADMRSAREETASLRDIAESTRQPFILHVAEQYGATIALADGRLHAAEAMMQRSEEAGRSLTGRDASGTFGIQMFSLRREQGRLMQLAPVMRVLASSNREHGPWRPGLASLLAELGMEEDARRELARVASDGLAPLRQSLWTAALTYLTDACAALGDQTVAALVYPELAPLAGTNVMIGNLVACYGAADRYLGMLAATLGEWESAERHFKAAIELNRRMKAKTWLAHTLYEYARMLLRARPGEAHRTAALLQESTQLATEIGMSSLQARIMALQAPTAPAALPDRLSAREVQILQLIARGLSNRQIGAELFISEHTAANHVRSILRKTGCANRTDAASYAHHHNLADSNSGEYDRRDHAAVHHRADLR